MFGRTSLTVYDGMTGMMENAFIFYCAEERGQAHLPDPELIGVEL